MKKTYTHIVLLLVIADIDLLVIRKKATKYEYLKAYQALVRWLQTISAINAETKN